MFNEINESSPLTWAKISNGFIVVKSDESDTKAKSRVNKLGNTVWERAYASIYGKITTLTIEENKFGETDIRVGIEFGEKRGVLTISQDSSYGRSFMAQIFNVDCSRQVIFQPWQKIDANGKKVSRLYLSYSRNESILWKYPEGTPEVKFVDTKKGKVVDPVSKANHEDFIETQIHAFINRNGLVYEKPVEDLTEEERAQLRAPKSTGTGIYNGEVEEMSVDQFLDRQNEDIDDLFSDIK